MAGKRTQSGVVSVPVDDLIEHRIDIAWDGFETGTWSHGVAEAAERLALMPDLPTDDDSWIALLSGIQRDVDRLEAELSAEEYGQTAS